MRKNLVAGILAVLLTFGLLLVGCPIKWSGMVIFIVNNQNVDPITDVSIGGDKLDDAWGDLNITQGESERFAFLEEGTATVYVTFGNGQMATTPHNAIEFSWEHSTTVTLTVDGNLTWEY
jgi:hypothetical protein